MSSSGITPINSGPLILRTYLNSSSNNTYAVGPYDDPVPTNRILVTSTGGLVVPSDSLYVSSLTVSTLNASSIVTSSLIASVADISSLTVSTLNASSIVTSSLIASVADISSLTVSTLNASSIVTSSLIASVADISSLMVSTLNASSIVTSSLIASVADISSLMVSTLNVSTLNASTLYVSNVADISTLVVSTLHVGVIDGCVTISTLLSPSTLTFTTPGSYIVPIEDETSMAFEMIGAGGFGGTGGTGGTGGYITGTINLPSGATQIKVVVGGVGGGAGGGPSGASYITIPSVGPLLAIAGAGGASDGAFITAGWGGGGTFTSGVAPGGNAFSFSGGGGGGGSIVTPTEGGLAGTECFFPTQGTPGGDAGSSGLFDEALGGFSPATAMTPGGSGYAGGGSGCGGGGGSSYIDVAAVVGITSYAGNFVPLGTLPGYGRSNLGGYVSITLSHDDCNNVSLTTNGGINVGTLLSTSALFASNATVSTLSVSSLIRNTASYFETAAITYHNEDVVYISSSGTTPVTTLSFQTLSSYTNGMGFKILCSNTAQTLTLNLIDYAGGDRFANSVLQTVSMSMTPLIWLEGVIQNFDGERKLWVKRSDNFFFE